MSWQGTWKWGLVLLVSIVVFAAGCAKKQTVRSNTAESMQAAVRPAPPAGPVQKPMTTETVKEAAVSPPKTPATAPGIAVTEERKSPFADIHFDFDKSFIKGDDRPVLEKIAAYMKQHPGARVKIEGNCDERGTAEYNMALGDRRAQSAKTYLVTLGVPANEISTISFGKEKPLDPGHDEAAWAKNRRDHFDKM